MLGGRKMVDLLLTGGTTTANTVASVIQTNSISFSGILEEVVNLLPVTIPVLVGFLGIRKGISFLIGSLRRA